MVIKKNSCDSMDRISYCFQDPDLWNSQENRTIQEIRTSLHIEIIEITVDLGLTVDQGRTKALALGRTVLADPVAALGRTVVAQQGPVEKKPEGPAA